MTMTHPTDQSSREQEAPPVIVVFPRGQLSEDDKSRMEMHGILCIEADSPKDVCQLHLTTPLCTTLVSGDAVLRAALAALSVGEPSDGANRITSIGRARSEFVRMFAESLKEPTA